ncbi:MAG: Two component serine/threonine protein kinase with sensor(S) [Modestobacter sp.]|jgi:serine/threonine protein kinase|nr:Two component serine/threonine protein kinase with sensor(S) [Modestobacter sp.]
MVDIPGGPTGWLSRSRGNVVEPRGRTFGSRYELSTLIATGGMGQVWQARDTLLNRDVAVKVLRSEYTGDPTFVARFRAEAQLSAGLVHPNIATLFDYGEVWPETGDGEHLAYLVMELVRGESLSALMAREGRLGSPGTLDIVRQSAAGLAAAHEAGVVHRDVKPGNVLLAFDGRVKITDFGVAQSAASVSLTETGQVIGTAHYLSPEQAQGARATPASDVYALGVVAYECLAGRRAFEGENSVQIALKQIRETPAPLPDDVPEAVRRLVERAIVKDPAERFPDGAAFRDAIDDVIAGRPMRGAVPDAPTSVLPAAGAVPLRGTAPIPAADGQPFPDPEPDRGRRRRLLLPVLALLALAAIVAGTLQVVGGATTSAESATPSPTTASATPASSSPVPTAPPVLMVALSTRDYVGRPVAEVQAELLARGLQVALRPVQTPDVPDGQVIVVDPAGELSPGTLVTVTHAVAPPAAPVTTVAPAPVPAPDTTPSDSGSGTGSGSGWGSGWGNSGNGEKGGDGNGRGRDKQDD